MLELELEEELEAATDALVDVAELYKPVWDVFASTR
jgi:hypothetical protein